MLHWNNIKIYLLNCSVISHKNQGECFISDTAKYLCSLKEGIPQREAKQNSGAFSSCQTGEVPLSRNCTGKRRNWSQAGDRDKRGATACSVLSKPEVWEKDLWNQTRQEKSKMPRHSSLLCRHEMDRNSSFVMS